MHIEKREKECGDRRSEVGTVPLLPDSFGFLRGTGPSPSYPLWTVQTSLPRSQPSFVLLPKQEKTEGEFFMQRLRTPSAGSNSPPPWLSRIRASPGRHLRHHFFQFDLWSRLGLFFRCKISDIWSKNFGHFFRQL